MTKQPPTLNHRYESPNNPTPIGMAPQISQNDYVPGRWIIADRRFVPVDDVIAKRRQ